MLYAKVFGSIAAATLTFGAAFHVVSQGQDPTTKQGGRKGQGGGNGQGKRTYPAPVTAWSKGSLILGCPTDHSIGLAVHLNEESEAYVEYGKVGSTLNQKTSQFSVKPVTPAQITIDKLTPNTQYSYRLKYHKAGDTNFEIGEEHTFKTQIPAGKPFMFFVQGDSHPERYPKMNVPDLYERTLKSAAEQKPDFFLCLGDDFSVDTLRERTAETVEGVYKKQVPYLGIVGQSAPIFLVNGNHEQASKANLDGTPNSVAVLAQNARNRNFMQPAPDSFYSGDEDKVDNIGLLRNYYAWTWGDATFVVIDPYWHSKIAVDNALGTGPKEGKGGGKGNRDLWDITLGTNQYNWLKRTLEQSKSKFKFVFAHHVHGTSRGGVEQAPFYEWGGKGRNGVDMFKEKRPGWEMPIHQLFVKNGVTIFFQGHDHIFAKQELDGVIYQSCPVPADATNELMNGDAYISGDKLVGAGLVRVSVNPEKSKIEFLRSFQPAAEVDGHKHGEIAYSYEVKPRSK